MGFKFGQRSRQNLDTCHIDIQKVLNLAIKRSRIDFGVIWGHRPVSVQQQLYAQGRTKPGVIVTNIDGVNKMSKHNKKPSDASDVCPYINGKYDWDVRSLIYIAGVIESCAQELKEKGKITSDIRWGGNWDRDGVIIDDQRFTDLPHFERV